MVPTMTAAELADWERRLRSGSLWDHGQPRYAYWRPLCVCGHRQGHHARYQRQNVRHYVGACGAMACGCEAFQEVGE